MFNIFKKEEKWILLSIPILFIVGALFHFLYDFSNQSPILALISPVNESIWEHNKMVVLPPILLWILFYCIKGKNFSINKDKWFTSSLVSTITMLITIPMLFYFYTQAFGVELLWVDILILLIANILGQVLGLHVYKYSKGIPWYISIITLCFIILLFSFFTYYPPHIPLFIDSTTGLYGLQ